MATENIEQYCVYFEEELQKIDSHGENLQSRILLATILDALSRAGHPHLAKKNHDRIIKFIEVYVQWNDRDKVSLPQTMYKLEKAEMTNGALYKKVARDIASWERSTVVGPDADAEFLTIIKIAKCDCERKILKASKYKELLYSHRNHLVHEYRNPGDGFIGASHSAEPYYHQSGSKWELVFPVQLLSSFCHKGLAELKTKLLAEGRDPSEAYDFGSVW